MGFRLLMNVCRQHIWTSRIRAVCASLTQYSMLRSLNLFIFLVLVAVLHLIGEMHCFFLFYFSQHYQLNNKCTWRENSQIKKKKDPALFSFELLRLECNSDANLKSWIYLFNLCAARNKLNPNAPRGYFAFLQQRQWIQHQSSSLLFIMIPTEEFSNQL